MKQPVTAIISERAPATIELALVAALFAVGLGIPMGVYTGIHRESWLSKVFLSVSLIGVSLPTFLIGIFLIYVFAVKLGVLPSFGRGEVVRLGFWRTGLLTASGLKALILPAITLGIVPDDPGDATGPGGNAGGAAHRLHQVRACARPDAARHQLRARLEEHPGARHHRHRPAARRRHRLRHHYRDGVPMARHGTDVHSGRAECRYSRDGRLSAVGGVSFRY